jgi:uncharacterized protein (TIGR00369 family)
VGPDSAADWDRYWATVQADMAITLGIEHVAVDEGRVVMSMPFKPEISQAIGLFSAGALIQLADVAATWLCSLQLHNADAPQGTFPLAVQLSTNLVANTDHGDAVAHASLISAGRTVMVTHTDVRDEDQRLLMTQTGTYVVRRPRENSSPQS